MLEFQAALRGASAVMVALGTAEQHPQGTRHGQATWGLVASTEPIGRHCSSVTVRHVRKM
jgi:hypothetical protein